VILAVGNGVWFFISERITPLVALVAYAVVSLVVMRSNDYGAGMIIGIAGFTIHVVELAIQGTANLGPLERTWLYVNIALPLALVLLNWILIRRTRFSKSTFYEDGGASRPHN
jgi:hypothetical protein